MPFCGVATIDTLRGERSAVEDPAAVLPDSPWQALQPHQQAALQAVIDGPLGALRQRFG